MGRMGRVIIVSHKDPAVAGTAIAEVLQVCLEADVPVSAAGTEFEKHDLLFSRYDVTRLRGATQTREADLCIALGGDGTMLRAFHLVRGSGVPVAGVNLGRVGFLTTVERDDVRRGVERLLAGEFVKYPLLGLVAECQGKSFPATNDVVVSKGDRGTACTLALRLNGVTMFEVPCDGVVVGTPAGSSAYSLAAGGPLLGIAVDAYVISLVAAHAVGVRPVVAAPDDLLEITNTDEHGCYLDTDGQRMLELPPRTVVRIRAVPDTTCLALLKGDSLYHHFRNRLL